MRIGVVSDSHGDLYMLDRAISLMGEIDMLIHLGDHYRDIIKVNNKYNYKIYYVPGNNDYISNNEGEKIIEVNKRRIFLTHGHRYNVNLGIMSLAYKAEEEKVNIVLFGHTHRYNIEFNNDIFFLNPGSVSRPRDKSASASILNIDDKGDVYAEKIVISY